MDFRQIFGRFPLHFAWILGVFAWIFPVFWRFEGRRGRDGHVPLGQRGRAWRGPSVAGAQLQPAVPGAEDFEDKRTKRLLRSFNCFKFLQFNVSFHFISYE